MKHKILFLCVGAWSFSLAACGVSSGSADLTEEAGLELAQAAIAASEQGDGAEDVNHADPAFVTIYIGSDDQFEEYLVEYTGEKTETGQVPVTELLSAMSELTGWNLDLADQVYSGRGGITVTFADTCTLLAQPEETMDATVQRDQVVLDSVKRTLQCWAVDPELGDPEKVDIWFCGPDGGDLNLTGTGRTLSSIEPYQQFPAA